MIPGNDLIVNKFVQFLLVSQQRVEQSRWQGGERGIGRSKNRFRTIYLKKEIPKFLAAINLILN
jgi:hypothetical protein